MKMYALVFGLVLASACALADDTAPLASRVMSQEQQSQLTPDAVIAALHAGNERFLADALTTRNHSSLVRDAISGQYPQAIVLSCVDSRVPIEDIFDQPLGNVFVARVAANIENTDILGSIEFATKVTGSKVVLVLGHENCGAVRAAIDNVKLGNITALLENVRPAVVAMADYPGEKTSSNPEYVHLVAEQNVLITMRNIREKSPVVAEMEAAGEVKIVGALYDLKTGVVEFLDSSD